MDPFVVSVWGTAALLTILFKDPNVPVFIRLRVSQSVTSFRGAVLGGRLRLSLELTRRSFRNDWLGRRLRDIELHFIQRNPAYPEFFDGSLGAGGGSTKEH